MSSVSGLGASIRGSTESETFDLAGLTLNSISNNVTNAFQEPLPISEMIRITFVTGAGKLARQKYDENAAKAVTSALRELGFEDDRGASCVLECAGSFKLQHDTGKNLKTVVVFPRVQGGSSASDIVSGEEEQSEKTKSFLPPGSPEEMIALSSTKVFERMAKDRCQSWSQKKGCMAALEEIKSSLNDLESKLLNGTPLSDVDQEFYDQVSIGTLEEKQEFLREQMHQQVDADRITSEELKQLKSQLQARLEVLESEVETAENNKQAKKVQVLKTRLEKANSRKEKLSKLKPIEPLPLKFKADIFKLRSELKPLLEMEANAKGRLLSVKETKSLARKDEILDEIAELEENSRGWFESDVAFQARIEASHKEWSIQDKSSKKSTKKAPSKPASSGWVTASSTKTSSSSGVKSKRPPAKKKGSSSGGVFAAMMMDSDSD